MRSLIAVCLLVAACGGSSEPEVDARVGGDAVATDGAAGSDGGGADGAAADGAGPTADASEAARRCTSTGGTVDTILCCGATGDFANMCSIGACGCAPGSSHDTLQCRCADGSCYDPALGCLTP